MPGRPVLKRLDNASHSSNNSNSFLFLHTNQYNNTSIIKPSFYYPCVAVGKILAIAVFLAGRDCQILQITTQKRNAFRDLQILLVEPAKKPKTAKFWRPTHMGNNRRILLTRTIQGFMRMEWFCSLLVVKKWRPRLP